MRQGTSSLVEKECLRGTLTDIPLRIVSLCGFRHLGGMMRYGIPGFRTPRAVLDAEIQRIADLGVTLQRYLLGDLAPGAR